MLRFIKGASGTGKSTFIQNEIKDFANTENIADITARARAFKDDVLTIMQSLREAVDALENIVSADYWPFPTYGELLFGINE